MAWALQLNSGEQAVPATSISLPGDFRIDFDVYIDPTNTLFNSIFGQGITTAHGLLFYNNGTVRFRIAGSTTITGTIPYGDISGYIQRVGSTVSWDFAGLTGSTTKNGTLVIDSFNRYNGGTYGTFQFKKISIQGLHNWDATASSHSAGTPVLTDTIGGNNATGVNFPTDGSAWVNLGGGLLSITSDLELQNQLLGSVFNSVELQNQILSALSSVTSDLELRNQIYASVIADKELQQAIFGTVLRDTELQTCILSFVQQDTEFQTQLFTSVSSTVELQNAILSNILTVTRDLELRTQIYNAVVRDVDLRNQLLNSVNVDVNLKNQILATVNANVELQSQILTNTSADIELQSQIYTFTTNDIELQTGIYASVYQDVLLYNSVDGVVAPTFNPVDFTIGTQSDSSYSFGIVQNPFTFK